MWIFIDWAQQGCPLLVAPATKRSGQEPRLLHGMSVTDCREISRWHTAKIATPSALDPQSKAEPQTPCHQETSVWDNCLKYSSSLHSGEGVMVCGLGNCCDGLKLLHQFWVYISLSEMWWASLSSRTCFETVEVSWQKQPARKAEVLTFPHFIICVHLAVWMLIKDNVNTCLWCKYIH